MFETTKCDTGVITRLADAFRQAGITSSDSQEEMARKFVDHFSPTFEIISRTDEGCVMAITPSLESGLLSCIINGDKNYKIHSGPGGIEHSLIRIGQNALVVADFFPGQVLVRIEHIKFRKPVPLGTTVCISLTKKVKRGPLTTSLMEGWVHGDEKKEPLFNPCKIVTCKLNP